MTRLRLFVTACAAILAGGCMMQNQDAPLEMGPSGFGQLLTLTATPDVLARDGSSQSVIRLNYRDGATNQPLAQRRIALTVSAGTLSASDVVTDSSGNASVTLTAPGVNNPVSVTAVTALPVGTNADNAVEQIVRIRLLGPDVPVAAFTYQPTAPTAGAAVTFDATGTTVGGTSCGTACEYSWTFGDGSSGSGRVVQHTFATAGVHNVTLTVTGPSGTSNSTTTPVVVAAAAPGNGGGGSGALVASFTVTTATPTANAPVDFDASSSSGASSYAWDFGDGNSSVPQTTSTISHTYNSSGIFTVVLTVTGSGGTSATLSMPVTVAP